MHTIYPFTKSPRKHFVQILQEFCHVYDPDSTKGKCIIESKILITKNVNIHF